MNNEAHSWIFHREANDIHVGILAMDLVNQQYSRMRRQCAFPSLSFFPLAY